VHGYRIERERVTRRGIALQLNATAETPSTRRERLHQRNIAVTPSTHRERASLWFCESRASFVITFVRRPSPLLSSRNTATYPICRRTRRNFLIPTSATRLEVGV